MINRFREYLIFLDQKLAKMFEKQKTFIKCKKGCAYCCQEGEYPLSELEYINTMFYYNTLPNDVKTRVNNKIKTLLNQKNLGLYECPFLIDGVCSVYPARSIICRTFGLISYDENDKRKMPFCIEKGLNFAEVYDPETNMLTKKAKDGTEPLAFNISRRYLRSKSFEQQFNIYFGEDKALVDWLREEDFDFMK